MWGASGVFTLEKWLGDFSAKEYSGDFLTQKNILLYCSKPIGHSAEHKRKIFEEYDGWSSIYWKWRETGSVKLQNDKKHSSFKPKQNTKVRLKCYIHDLSKSDHFFITFNLHLPSCVSPTALPVLFRRNLFSFSLPPLICCVILFPSPTQFSSMDVNTATDT